jgi:hypothetical protein
MTFMAVAADSSPADAEMAEKKRLAAERRKKLLDQVHILSKVTNVGLQIFVIGTFYIFLLLINIDW